MALATGYSSFFEMHSNRAAEKRQILNITVSQYGRDSEQYQQIAAKELEDLMNFTKTSVLFSPSLIERIKITSKLLLDIPLTDNDQSILLKDEIEKSKKSEDEKLALRKKMSIIPLPGKKFAMFVFGIGMFLSAIFYVANQADNVSYRVSTMVSYDSNTVEIKKIGFETYFNQRFDDALHAVKQFDSGYLGYFTKIQYFLFSQISGFLYPDYPDYMLGHYFRRVESMEVAKALVMVYGDKTRLSYQQHMYIVNNLGKLDSGYSKSLANFIAKYMDKRAVIALERDKPYSDYIEKVLKKNNQISALSAYRKLKRNYGIK